MAQWLTERSRRCASSIDIVAEFFDLRESVVEPAVNDLIRRINEIAPITFTCDYLQVMSGGGWSMAGIRYVVWVEIEKERKPIRCEIELTASVEDDFIRSRAARGYLPFVGGREAGLPPGEITAEKVQRVFLDLLIECLDEVNGEGLRISW